jgi:glycosyltransferase involved in cell wall biosynthesis
MKTAGSLVSVIVPTRNSARTLAGCLTSIRNQSHPEIELIVVDNQSSDGSLAIATEFADRVESAGPERSAQRNRGASIAKGDYLLFIDSDMRLNAGVVTDCLATMRRTSAPGVIIPESSIGTGFWAKVRTLERTCYEGDDSVEAARFVSRSTFQQVGGFDESLTGPEDWDFSRRIASGSRLPRTASRIVHDEGHPSLGGLLARKRRYGRSLRAYMSRSSGGGNWHDVVFRSAYIRCWRNLLSHPVLTTGLLILKPLELVAVLTSRGSRTDQYAAVPTGRVP